MVEAALIFPVLIVTISAIIGLAINFYEDVSKQTDRYLLERETNLVHEMYQGKEAIFIRTVDTTLEVVN